MTSHNPGMPTPQVLEPGGQPCCETGRPVMTDPLTGQTLCSCQYETQQSQLLNFHRLAAAGLSAYGSSAQYTPDAGGVLPLGADPAAFFNPTMPPNGFDIKDNLDAWRMLPYASLYYPYDPSAFAGYPFAAGYAIDINGARRKNATRETTSTLKAWLNEHRKNPYPTKGEKIMLAIITKMTLTQVSTWFANARRRLKKENKMTWEPRNRCDEDDDDLDGDDDDFSDEKEKKRGSGTHESDDEEKKSESYGVRSASEIGKAVTEGSRSISRESLSPKSPGSQDSQRLTTLSPSGSPSITPDIRRGDKSDLCSGSSQPKPRIWSIADMATSKISRTSETDDFVPATSNHQTLIPPGALPRNLHSGSSILPPMITSNWYAPPSATSHLASHRHHPHFPFTSSSPVVTHPAFHGATSPGSNCTSVVSVFNDSMAVASSLTRLRSAAAAATAPLFRSPLNDSPSQSSTPPPSSHTGSISTIQSPKREILKRDETHSLPSTSDSVKVS